MRLLFSLVSLFLILSGFSAMAQTPLVTGSVTRLVPGVTYLTNAPVAAPCSTVDENNTSVVAIQNCSLHRYWAGWFQATSTASMCSVSISIGKHGSPTANVAVLLYTFNATGPVPGTLIASSSTTISASTLSTTDAMVNFTLPASKVSGTKYFIVMDTTTAGDASNYVQWDLGAVLGSGGIQSSDDAAAWTSVSTRGALYEIFQ